MLNETDEYAIGWAQRECVENQPAERVREYISWFKKNVLKKLNKKQAEHLSWDLTSNYLPSQERLAETYPEDKVPDEVYELVRILGTVTTESYRPSAPIKDLFPLARWSCNYCMRRKSYAATFIHDAIKHYFPKLSPEEIETIAADVREYKEFCDKMDREFMEKYPDFYEKHPYMRGDRCPDKCWLTFLDYMDKTNRHTAITTKGDEIEVFLDKQENRLRPIGDYLKSPHQLYYLPVENIKKFKD